MVLRIIETDADMYLEKLKALHIFHNNIICSNNKFSCLLGRKTNTEIQSHDRLLDKQHTYF